MNKILLLFTFLMILISGCDQASDEQTPVTDDGKTTEERLAEGDYEDTTTDHQVPSDYTTLEENIDWLIRDKNVIGPMHYGELKAAIDNLDDEGIDVSVLRGKLETINVAGKTDVAAHTESPEEFIEEKIFIGEEIKSPEEIREKRLKDLKADLRVRGQQCDAGENSFDPVESLIIDPNGNIYIASGFKGIHKSTDQGKTWKLATNGILAYPRDDNIDETCWAMVGIMKIDPNNPQRILASQTDVSSGTILMPYAETAGLWESLDAGASWKQILSETANAAGRGALAIDPNNPDIIYFGGDSDVASFSEENPKRELATKGVLYKSIDSGKTWEELPTGLIEGIQGVKVFINPKDSNELILFTQSHTHGYVDGVEVELPLDEQKGPIRSLDGGLTWTSFADSLPIGYRATFGGEVSLNNFDHIFANPLVFGEGTTYDDQKTFYSTDGGKTFFETPINLELAKYDPHDAAGNHMLGYTIMSRGLMESNDAGKTWNQLGEFPAEINNHESFVSNIVWDPNDPNNIYISGTDANLWVSTDSGQTWENILNIDMI